MFDKKIGKVIGVGLANGTTKMIYRLDYRKCELPKRPKKYGKVTGIEIVEFEEAYLAAIFRENPTILSIVLLNNEDDMTIIDEIELEEGQSLIQ